MRFQFLSRNSVRWDSDSGRCARAICSSFNSSVGILSVGTGKIAAFGGWEKEFQFLSRNSVRWDRDPTYSVDPSQPPFQFLSRNSVRWDRGFPA